MRRASVTLASIFLAFAAVLVLSTNCGGPKKYPFWDPSLPLEQRLDDLLSRMTLQEKVSQMVNRAAAIPRLGIPEYDWWNECLHGVARAGIATVFPQAIGIAATWDRPLVRKMATVISDEARAKHHEFLRHGLRRRYQGLTFWSPNINIFRDPRWGRGMETYGEDPFLTGTLAIEFVKGLQGDDPKYLKTVATPKHFAVHSGPEPERHHFDAVVGDRDLWDTYLPGFEMAVRVGGAYSVMCAYNRFRGEACCGSKFLLTEILRGRWGFEGYVVSDCGAIRDIWRHHKVVATAPEAVALAVKSGTDLNCGSQYDSLGKAVELGLITEAEIDTAVRRLFRARFKLGMFDPPESVRYAQIPFEVNNSPEHADLALRVARESIVLLKNNGLLPLDAERFEKIAVIGPNGDDELCLLGNYTGTPANPWTLYRALRERLGRSAEVCLALGCDAAEGMPSFEPIPASALRTDTTSAASTGLRAEYFNKTNLEGKVILSRVDTCVDFNWFLDPPCDELAGKAFSVRWTGYLIPPLSGRYFLAGIAAPPYRILIEDTVLVEHRGSSEPFRRHAEIELEAGKPVKLQVEYAGVDPESQRRPSFTLLWSRPESAKREEALEAARWADLVILAMGLSPRLEGEERRYLDIPGFKGGDRTDLALPKPQRELMQEIASLGKPTVLVLFTGSALAVNWAARNLPAIVLAWYPGQEGGKAIADVLFGDYNPAGRLPVTFYRSVADLPPFEDYSMENRTYRYFRGPVLFPFGYGLSYTRFRYRNLRLPAQVTMGQPVDVSVTVQNVGDRAGDEVVQLYVTDVVASVRVPIRALRGYRRIHLEPGEERTVEFRLEPKDLAIVLEDGRRMVEPGVFEVAVGGKQPGFTGLADAATTGVLVGRFRLVGDRLQVD